MDNPCKMNLCKYIDTHRGLWVWLWLMGILSLFDIPGSPVFGLPPVWSAVYLLFASAFKGSLILLLLIPLLCTKRMKWLAYALTGVYSLMAVTNAFCYAFYDMGISRKLLFIFAQTTPDEAAGFLPGLWHNIAGIFRHGAFYLAAGVTAALYAGVKKFSPRVFMCLFSATALIGLCCITAFALSYSSGRSAHLLSARMVKYGSEVYRWNSRYHEILQQKKPLPHAESVRSDHLAHTAIVIVGESAAKKHHSLYGYPLPTTPEADRIADSLYVFTDVIASSKSTAGNMERILSFKEDDRTFGDGLDHPLLIDLFNAAGYRTYWLSNQERTGSVSNTSGVMVMNSDVIKYVGADNSEDALCVRYDEALLPELDRALADTAVHKLIFLHLLGSHVEFRQRYPQKFDLFTHEDETKAFLFPWLDKASAQRRAEYDNSIRYTDFLLSSIIQKASLLPQPAIVVYFSDHGENLYETGSYTGRDNQAVEIPFYVYLNRHYSSQNPDIERKLAKGREKSFSSANFVHMLMTLTGSRYALYDAALDPLSDSCVIRPRYVDEEVWPADITVKNQSAGI